MTQRGATLIELIVAMAIIGIVVSVATVNLHVPTAGLPDAVGVLRQRAIVSRHVATEVVIRDGKIRSLAAFPDGRVVGDAGLGLNPLSGRADDATH